MLNIPRIRMIPSLSMPRRGREFDYVTPAEGKRLLDRQAKKYLKMSGDEFKAKYAAGRIADPDRADVIRVAMLIPLADD